MIKDAQLSEDRVYRYALWRKWDARPQAMFIGLNPSTADEVDDDPTIRRCVGFAKSWGYGGIIVANLFGFRATDPTELQKATDPVGPENDTWLCRLANDAGLVVAAWGDGGRFNDRGRTVMAMFSDMHCIKINKSGQPAHPLYLRGALKPMPLIKV